MPMRWGDEGWLAAGEMAMTVGFGWNSRRMRVDGIADLPALDGGYSTAVALWVGSSSTKRCLRSMSMSAMASESQRVAGPAEGKKMDRVCDHGAESMGMNTYQILDKDSFMKVSGRRMLVLGGERWEVRRHRWVRAYEVSPEAKNGLGPVTWESGDIKQNSRLDSCESVVRRITPISLVSRIASSGPLHHLSYNYDPRRSLTTWCWAGNTQCFDKKRCESLDDRLTFAGLLASGAQDYGCSDPVSIEENNIMSGRYCSSLLSLATSKRRLVSPWPAAWVDQARLHKPKNGPRTLPG
ncbi:hypothetical protein PVAR5_0279 [Paecilomyces variotii No. 5]|uniref:Uncharacterized protein n=1 Tax=Byssochlamys spectabilis (strain No. 5 / NBRC 109023) TaxID=1356009 RepID=V5HQX2_BYSSN|nr:hypothetical protein PVAR5_0279 [Paecilomyces variotii No. 5]